MKPPRPGKGRVSSGSERKRARLSARGFFLACFIPAERLVGYSQERNKIIGNLSF